MRPAILAILGVVLIESSAAAERRSHLDTDGLPAHLRDRGEGQPLSMFGTYIQKGQCIFYPFFEYYLDKNAEYAPDELGASDDQDYRGEYHATEGLIFLAYGVTDRLALEFEGAVIDAKLETASNDPSGLPPEIKDSGVGDVEGQVRWRWNREQADLPEFFSYFETVFPTNDEGSLIGTSDFEFKFGSGLVRGFSFGTMTVRAAVDYSKSEKSWGLGEVALEYLRRLSPEWRVYGGFEGTEDEIELITEAQWHFSELAFLKLNNAFGVTSKATDWAPEVGVAFTF
jgi:hypothetical protein